MATGKGGLHQAGEERMGVLGRALVLRMELCPDEERMRGQFHDLDKAGFRIAAGGLQAGRFEIGQIVVVELVAVTVPFAYLRLAVKGGGQRAGLQEASVGSQAHRPAFDGGLLLVFHHADDRMLRILGNFRRCGIGPT